MGTNYFHRTNICQCCNRYDERHIGKSSGGWQFSFRGYRDTFDEDGVKIMSYQDWLAILSEGGEIVSEYGEPMTLEEFKEFIHRKRGEKLNHTGFSKTAYPEHFRRDCWLDSEGYSFTDSEFS